MSNMPDRISVAWLCTELARSGWLSAPQAQDARLRLDATQSREHPLLRLSRLKLTRQDLPGRELDAESLVQWLAEISGLPYLKVDPLKVDIPRVTSVCSYAYAERAGILPLALSPRELTIGVREPGQRDWEAELSRIAGRSIRRVLVNPSDIDRYLVEFYALARSIKASEREQAARQGTELQNLEHLTELGQRPTLEANDQHVVAIVDWLLQYAFEQRASDIHLEPRRDTGNVRFRIDGLLHQVFQMPPKVMAAVTSRLKILARLDLAEKRRPQDGRIKTRSPGGEEIELRVSAMPTSFGEKLVMRIFDPEALYKSLGALGFDDSQVSGWEELTRQPHGLVLVTGPTGSGKTTTLYSSLRRLASPELNICTIEDPIELVEPLFNQMQVNSPLGVTFASGIRTLLRQDPDIIMVGEIRDRETAEVAIQAALTGHLVLSTLHTNDAPSAITRLLDLGVPSYLLRATLLGVLAQRLARQLCPHCKTPMPPDPEEWQALAGTERPLPRQIHGAAGCLECRATGFHGRIGLFELLPVDAVFRQQINEQADAENLRALARKQGLISLREEGIRKVLAGATIPREVLRLTPQH